MNSMNRFLLALFLLSSLPVLGANPSTPVYFESDGLKYQYFDGTEYWIGGYSRWDNGVMTEIPKEGDVCIVSVNPDYTGTDLVIPKTVQYNGKDIRVVGINAKAFADNQTITSVSFPSTFPQKFGDNYRYYDESSPYSKDAALMGASAFAGCSNLKKVIFSNGLTEFYSRDLFTGCPISEVVIPETLTKFNGFLEGSAVETIEIPAWVTTISFKDCTKLREIPELLGMTEIPQSCFSNCDALVNAVTPVNATSVGNYAFKDCDNLEKLVISDKVTTIGQAAADMCPKLEEVTIGSGVTTFASGCFNNSDAIKKVFFMPTTPPRFYQLGAPTTTGATAQIFSETTYENATAYVPDGTRAAYMAKDWFKFTDHNTTGVGNIAADNTAAPAEYFTIQGRQVGGEALTPGIYIKRQGDTTTKIIIR